MCLTKSTWQTTLLFTSTSRAVFYFFFLVVQRKYVYIVSFLQRIEELIDVAWMTNVENCTFFRFMSLSSDSILWQSVCSIDFSLFFRVDFSNILHTFEVSKEEFDTCSNWEIFLSNLNNDLILSFRLCFEYGFFQASFSTFFDVWTKNW